MEVGQACTPTDACATADLVCIDSKCQAKLEDGVSCYNIDENCVSGSCVVGFCSSGAAGQTCSPDVVCTSDDLVCVESKCQAKFADGVYCTSPDQCESLACVQGSCSSGEVGHSCSATDPCATEDLFCMDFKCKAKLAEGGYCFDAAHCDSGFCLFEKCSSVSGEGDIPDGQTCATDDQCLSSICINAKCSAPLADGLYCTNADHCESLACVQGFCSAGEVGHACTPTDDCATEDLICINSMCQAKLEDGVSCSNIDENCVSGLCVVGFCSSGAADQTCSPEAACASDDLVCIDSKCQAKLADGAYCTNPDHCESLACVQGFCSSGGVDQWCSATDACATEDLVCLDSKCKAKLAEGGYCLDAEHCESGFCLFGKCSSASGEGDIPDGQTCATDDQCLSVICINSKCSAPLPDRSLCINPDHCESLSCVLGSCSAGEVGQACTPTDACATEDLVCVNSKCQAKLADGAYCTSPDHCESLVCVYGFCSSGEVGQWCSATNACATEDLVCLNSKCKAKFAEGQSCWLAEQCQSGSCVFGRCSSATSLEGRVSPRANNADAKWYIDWMISKCVQSCDGPPPCRGLADPWNVLHSSMNACCDTHLGWRQTYEGCSL